VPRSARLEAGTDGQGWQVVFRKQSAPPFTSSHEFALEAVAVKLATPLELRRGSRFVVVGKLPPEE